MQNLKVCGHVLDELDKKIILHLQKGIEISERPYLKLAELIGLDEREITGRLAAMAKSGFIRKNAIATNHYLLGYTFNAMSVWEIDSKDIDEIGQRFKELGFVSHCYERPKKLPHWTYNLFAMVHGKSEEEVLKKVQIMKNKISDKFTAMDLIYSTQILKKTGIRFKEENNV